MGDFEDLLSESDDAIKANRTSLNSNLEDYFKTPQITPSQAFTQGIINILPMIIGAAVAKKKGALIGTKAGLAGSETYLKTVGSQNERDREKAKFNATIDQTNLNKELENKRDLRKLEITEGNKDERLQTTESNKFARNDATNAATIKAAQANKMNPAEADVWDLQKAAKQTERRGASILDTIDKMGAGNENAAEATVQNVLASNLFPESDRANIQRDLKEMALAGKAILGPGQLTDQERHVLDTIVGGNFNVPIQTVRSIAIKTVNKQMQTANDTVDLATEAGYNMNFKHLKPKDPRFNNNAELIGLLNKQFPGTVSYRTGSQGGKRIVGALDAQGNQLGITELIDAGGMDASE